MGASWRLHGGGVQTGSVEMALWFRAGACGGRGVCVEAECSCVGPTVGAA